MRNSCREAQLALTRTILGCSAWRRGVRARRAGSHGIRSWWYVWLVVGMVVRVCAQRAGLSLVGQVREKRSWFRASIVSDFFWGIINFVGLLYVRWFGWRCCWHVLTRPWLWLAQLQQFVWRTYVMLPLCSHACHRPHGSICCVWLLQHPNATQRRRGGFSSFGRGSGGGGGGGPGSFRRGPSVQRRNNVRGVGDYRTCGRFPA